MQRTFIGVCATVALSVVLIGGGLGDSAAVARLPSCPEPDDIDPANFVKPGFNAYLPINPGTTYVYRGKSDGDPTRIVVEVTHKTKVIQGVTTTVIHDRVFTKGELTEDTFDWEATDEDGNVWYFGEDTKEIEDGQVVSTEGSFEAGKNGAKAGIIMPARPRVGKVVAIESAKNVAEDCFRFTDLDTSVRSPFVDSKHALKRDEFTRLEPKVLENKYYVRCIGVVREQDVRGSNDGDALVSVTTEDDDEGRDDDDGKDDDDGPCDDEDRHARRRA